MSDDEKALIIVNELSGELYRVDPESGEATVIDLGGVFLRGGDGLVRGSCNNVVDGAGSMKCAASRVGVLAFPIYT